MTRHERIDHAIAKLICNSGSSLKLVDESAWGELLLALEAPSDYSSPTSSYLRDKLIPVKAKRALLLMQEYLARQSNISLSFDGLSAGEQPIYTVHTNATVTGKKPTMRHRKPLLRFQDIPEEYLPENSATDTNEVALPDEPGDIQVTGKKPTMRHRKPLLRFQDIPEEYLPENSATDTNEVALPDEPGDEWLDESRASLPGSEELGEPSSLCDALVTHGIDLLSQMLIKALINVPFDVFSLSLESSAALIDPDSTGSMGSATYTRAADVSWDD